MFEFDKLAKDQEESPHPDASELHPSETVKDLNKEFGYNIHRNSKAVN